MTAHHQIRRTLYSGHGRALLSTLPAAESFSGRSEMARAVCGLFGFVDARGGLREASCLAALRELEEAGGIRLPPPGRGFGISRKPRVLDEAVAPAAGVPACVHEVGGLHIRLIEGDAERRILSTLLRDEHPQGAVQHGGRQLRYLIGSDHGWLVGFVFASPCSALGAPGPLDRLDG